MIDATYFTAAAGYDRFTKCEGRHTGNCDDGRTLFRNSSSGGSMSRLTLQDSRRLKFTVPALLDAALTFDREHNGWLWRASGHSLVVDAGGGGAVTIEARKAGAGTLEIVNRSPAWVAAALLLYCFKRRIPIPRQGSKTLEVLPGESGVAMLIEVTKVWAALELSPEAVGVAAKPRQQTGAPSVPGIPSVGDANIAIAAAEPAGNAPVPGAAAGVASPAEAVATDPAEPLVAVTA